jgi:hypothetical protein
MIILTNGGPKSFILPQLVKEACERPPHAQWARPAGDAF